MKVLFLYTTGALSQKYYATFGQGIPHQFTGLHKKVKEVQSKRQHGAHVLFENTFVSLALYLLNVTF